VQEQRIKVRGMSAVQVFGENLERLVTGDYGRAMGLDSNAKLGKKTGLSDNTIGRARRARKAEALGKKSAAQLDTVYKIARAYGFQAWQLLIPGFDPANPPADPPLTQAKKTEFDELRQRVQQF